MARKRTKRKTSRAKPARKSSGRGKMSMRERALLKAKKLGRRKRSAPVLLVRAPSSSVVGKSNTTVDRERRAMPPGYRLSKNGNVYYESRRRRTDTNKRKRL